jgi:5-methylcytosine-specific restriction enzyme subunit McrC
VTAAAAMNLTAPDNPVLVLQEYGTGEVELTAAQERILRRLARGRLTILPGDTADTWRIKASCYVGTIVTPAVRILITPKVATANLFYLLEASGQPLAVGAATFDYEQASDLIPSFATFFARHLETALTQGVPRAYHETQERLAGIRGRVDLPAQLRLAGLPLPAECRFDDYTGDTPLNRILRGAAARLLRLPGVTIPTRQALQRLTAQLGEAGPPSPADLHSRTVFTRLNEHCRPAEHLARMILGNTSLLDAAGAAGAAVFLLDMNKAFEDFVASRLTRYLTGHLIVRAQRPERLDTAGQVRIKPDLAFERTPGTTAYIADSKYKITSDGFGREADYYQILAYTSALNVPEGMLIYCQHDGTAPPQQIHVRNLGTRLATWALRLDRTPRHVEQELQALATQITTRADAALPKTFGDHTTDPSSIKLTQISPISSNATDN